jgi:hypothetical protein
MAKANMSNQHMDAFWHYLASRGITSHRSVCSSFSIYYRLADEQGLQGIVNAIAQKVDIMIPGIAKLDDE